MRSDLSRVNATHMPAGTPLTNLHTLTFLQSADDVRTPQRGCHMDILENTFYDSTVQSLFHMFSTKEHSYQKDVHNAVLHHNLIIVENLSPVLSPQEREKQKQEITKSLYEVFKKYSDNHKSNRS